MNRPLGCLTGSALIAAALSGLVVLGAAALTGNSIFSPGPLNAQSGQAPLGGAVSHRDLERDCGSCHPAFWSGERMGDRCLNCHVQVGLEIREGSGFHAGYADGSNCRDCHTEHHGSAAWLTRSDMAGFPHERTGYLLWAHRLGSAGGDFACSDCHPASLQDFDRETCFDCHLALEGEAIRQHLADFGVDCVACHDGIDLYGSLFDHGQTGFPLSGAHSESACGACHFGARSAADLRVTQTECVACHATDDRHQGRLGLDCGECHTTSAWSGATIDHTQTGFDLTGRHRLAACETCHVDRQWTGIGTACQDCHTRDDPHRGQFLDDCDACHQTSGWEDLTFDHRQTGFGLDDAHAISCDACHGGGRYAGTPTTCQGCHADDDRHAGRFGRDCGACHRPTRWDDVTFDHALSRFPLTGAHGRLDCGVCHDPGSFGGLSSSCGSCHADPAFHRGLFTSNCGSCHSTSAWRPASFNGPHPFPTNHEGAGGRCGECHPGPLTSYSCFGCHDRGKMEDKHKEITNRLADCAACHPRGEKEEDD